MDEPFDVLSQPVAQPCLKGLDDLDSPPLLVERAVAHLVGEGTLEGIFALGEESRLIRSSPTLHRPMRYAEDGVGTGEAIRAYLYCTWLPKESRKSWGT